MDMREVNCLNNLIEDIDTILIGLESLPKSRDLSVAITNIETAKLWLMKHQREVKIEDDTTVGERACRFE